MSKILLIGCGHMGTALVMSWLNLKAYSFTVVDPYNFIKLKKQLKSKKINILKKAPNQKRVFIPLQVVLVRAEEVQRVPERLDEQLGLCA